MCVENLTYLTHKGRNHRNIKSVNNNSLSVDLINIPSVNNKSLTISEHINDYNLDIMAIAETWLQSDSESVIEDVCPDGYLYVGLSRKSARGGGLCVIYRSTYDIHKISTDAYETFEHMCVLLKSSLPILLTIVYRPPPSNKNKFTVTKFIDEFENLLSELVTTHRRICNLGDFNFHWGNEMTTERNDSWNYMTCLI